MRFCLGTAGLQLEWAGSTQRRQRLRENGSYVDTSPFLAPTQEQASWGQRTSG